MLPIFRQNFCWIVFLLIRGTIHQSVNQPELCGSATWDSNGLTFADQSVVGDYPTIVFVGTNNFVYVAETNTSQVQAWGSGDVMPIQTFSNALTKPYGLFVSNNGDIYIDNGASIGRVEQWTWSATNGISIMNVSDSCYSLFVDANNVVYCSLKTLHQVVKTVSNTVGTGTPGSASNMLNEPHGIFVDSNFNLYVADSGNNRIQRFASGQSTGVTFAGTGSSIMVTLNYPTAVILDAKGNLFIADTNNDRIVRTDSTGFRCIVGCTGISGSASDQLDKPWSLSFDSYGNLFVTDQSNSRIQKFVLATNSCGPIYNQPKFCPTATWSADALTWADSSVIGVNPYSLFISATDNIYATAPSLSHVVVWSSGSSTPTGTIAADFNASYAIVTSFMDDIYVDYGEANRIDRLTSNNSIEMYVSSPCYGLFIDIKDVLYCSLGLHHLVLKKTILNDPDSSIIIAGTGVGGSASNMLNGPRGISVDNKFNLYVADCQNNRIQRFALGQTNAVTIAGNGASGTITLNCPTGLVLDGNNYVFITDFNNHRVIGSGPNGYRCLVGCTGSSGSSSNQLNNPSSLGFDSAGNVFVVDLNNNRIQQFLLATNSCGHSYNTPILCSSAVWNPIATTLGNILSVGVRPIGLFVDRNNTVYVAARTLHSIQTWAKGTGSPSTALFGSLLQPYSVYATITGDIYADSRFSRDRIEKLVENATVSTIAMYVDGICHGIFVDIYDGIYCSLGDFHKVIKRASKDDVNISTIVAGTGVSGSTSDMLDTPQGIFVTIGFSLYVADSANNRIQFFRAMQLNGSTVAGNGAPDTITLDSPTGVVLDSQHNLFIADSNNNRIVGSSPNGFRCIAGCSAGSGSAANQLDRPQSLSFDSFGNLFVADTYNNRVQKFTLSINACGRSYNLPKFCTYAAWNSIATTFADNTTVGSYPSDIFISINGTIFIVATDLNQAQIWAPGDTTPSQIISANLTSPFSIFASINKNIYIDNGASNNRVDKWMTNATTSVVEMYSNASCYDLYTDIYDNLYCSINALHVVMKKSFIDDAYTLTIAAGNGINGSDAYMLNGPRGIFIDTKFYLYVADCGNNRIQKFRSGQLNGSTIMENHPMESLVLSCPSAIVVDTDGYLFVADYNNHRIIATGPAGFRCIVGCTGNGGSAATELYYPRSLSFDNMGNLYVADTGNQRIQMFALATNSCYQLTTMQTTEDQSETFTVGTTELMTSSVSSIPPSAIFIAPTCPTTASIGPNCNVSFNPCDLVDPCQNDGTCFNDNTTLLGYLCVCPPNIAGTDCEQDYRICQSNTCWNNGSCLETSNTTYLCTCAAGWQNMNCEILINYCRNVTCLNRGVCRPLLLDFKCECLGDSYSGRFCETPSSRIETLRAVAKSFAYIAIIFIILVVAFIVFMDILTYCFGIDLTKAERQAMREKNHVNKKKKKKKKKKPDVAKKNDPLGVSSIRLMQRSVSLVERVI